MFVLRIEVLLKILFPSLKTFILFIAVIFTMTNVMAHTSLTLPKCNKHWPGIDVSFLAFDFDGTCTVHDTTSLFYKASEKYRNALDKEAQKIDQEWESIGMDYITGYQKTIERLLQKLPPQENGNLNEAGLKQFLMEVHKFDSQSTKRVESSKLLAGISHDGIVDIARNVSLKPGCLDVLEQLNLTLHVISFNWSKDLIKTVLGKLKYLSITGNDFPKVNNKSTGMIDKHVSSSVDKEIQFQNLLKAVEDRQSGLSVFIGDSIGDLLALLKADVGIIIGKSSTMKRVCQAFGVRLSPLTDLYGSVCDTSTSSTRDKNVLYETHSWQEIGELLLGKF